MRKQLINPPELYDVRPHSMSRAANPSITDFSSQRLNAQRPICNGGSA